MGAFPVLPRAPGASWARGRLESSRKGHVAVTFLTTQPRSVIGMLALSAETGLANNGLLQGVVVILASGAVTGVTTYVWLVRRFGGSDASTNKSLRKSTVDHLDEVLTERATAMGLRLPVERVGVKPVKVRFSDGSEVFYFERDLDRYDRYLYGGITPLDRSTVDDPPKTISEWTRSEKIRWLTDHPMKMDESDAR